MFAQSSIAVSPEYTGPILPFFDVSASHAVATGKATQKTMFLRYEKRIAGLGSYFDELEAAFPTWTCGQRPRPPLAAATSKKGKIGPVYGAAAMELWARHSDRKQSVKTAPVPRGRDRQAMRRDIGGVR